MLQKTAKFLIPILILVGILLFYSFGTKETTSISKNSQSLTKVKVGYMPIVECAHLYVAANNGYFAQEGLNVELVPMRGGAVIFPALESGDLDIGFGNVVSVITINTKKPNSIKILAGASYEREGHCNHALLFREEDNLNSEALASGGIRIAVNTARNIEDLMLRRYFSKRGIPLEKLNLVEMGFPEMLPALERKDVDVISVVQPFIEMGKKAKKYKVLDFQYLFVAKETLVATYGTTKNWLEKQGNKETAERFLKAFSKADEFIKTNDAETRKIISIYTRIKMEDVFLIDLPAFEAIPTKDSIQELYDQMVNFKFVQKDENFKVGDLFANPY